jgi:hydroxyethylthiazole kinase-like sugar kinase family protein
MADSVEEMEDLSKINDALLINIGTLRSGPRAAMFEAGACNNTTRKVRSLLPPFGFLPTF